MLSRPVTLNNWSVDPFGGEIKDGKIWGRGAADMKSGIAAFIAAVSDFLEKPKRQCKV